MMRIFDQRIYFAIIVLLAAACSSDLDRANPNDINAPLTDQARGTLTGTIVLEGETDYAGIEIRLKGNSLKDNSTDSTGAFALNEIIPGEYDLVISERGFGPQLTDGDVKNTQR